MPVEQEAVKAQRLSVWKFVDSETEWVVAHSRDGAIAFLADYYDYKSVEDFMKDHDGCEVFYVPVGTDLTIRDADDPTKPPVKKPVLHWLDDISEPCLLASTAL